MMDINWLFEATIESSLLIAGLLVLNPILRRLFNAQIPYLLWVVPLLAVVIWKKPERPMMVLDSATLPDGQQILQLIPNPDILFLPAYLNPFLIWLIGLVLYCLFRFVSWYRLQGLLNRASEHLLPKELIDLIPEKLKSVNARFYLTDLPSAPFVTGLLKPTIYLPDDFYSRFNREQQKWVITHELTHIRRLDLWSQCLAEVFRAVFWFNPLLYIAWPNFQEDQELACDYHTLKDSSLEERRQYGSAMMQGINANLLPATMAFFTLKKERFIMLQKHKKSKTTHLFGIAAGLAVGFIALTEAPKSIAVDQDKGIWMKTPNMDIREFVNRSAENMEKEVIGIELIPDGQKATIMGHTAHNISGEEWLDFVLSCRGFSFNITKNNLTIKKGDLSRMDDEVCSSFYYPNIPDGHDPDKEISLDFRNYPLRKIITRIGDFLGKNIVGDKMPKIRIKNMVIDKIVWREALGTILSCYGYQYQIVRDEIILNKVNPDNNDYSDQCLPYKNREDFFAHKKEKDSQYKNAFDVLNLGFHSPSKEFRRFLNLSEIPSTQHDKIIEKLNTYKGVDRENQESDHKFNLTIGKGDIRESKSTLNFWSYSSKSNILVTLYYNKRPNKKVTDIQFSEDKLDKPIPENHDSNSIPLESFAGSYLNANYQTTLKFTVKGNNLFVYDDDVKRWLRLQRKSLDWFGFINGPDFKFRNTRDKPINRLYQWKDSKDLAIKGVYQFTDGKRRLFDSISYYSQDRD